MSTIEMPRETEVRTEVTEADVLERAADLLEEFGWTQGAPARNEAGLVVGTFAKDATEFCAVAAVSRAWNDLGSKAGMDFSGHIELDLAPWNDTPGRTKAEVVARLRDAAQKARES